MLVPDFVAQHLRQKSQQFAERRDVRYPPGSDVLDPASQAARWLGVHVQLEDKSSLGPQLERSRLRGRALR